jgi:phage recombination protein Bet
MPMKTRKRKRQQHRKTKRHKKPQQQALVPYRRPASLEQKQIDLIRNLYAKNATDEEFELFMQICKSSRQDPLKKEIYFMKFQTKRGPQMVVVTGIEGYRATAARDHKDYAGADAATFTWFDPPQVTFAKKRIPESATVVVKDTRGNGTSATVWWEELAPSDLKAERSDFWNRMPKNQLEKCAEAKAIRKRFPGRGNIFIREELDQRLQDYTEEGREIHREGVAPSGRIVDEQIVASAERQKILDEKLRHGHMPGSLGAKNAEAALERVEKEDARLAEAKAVTGARIDAPKEPKPKKEPFADCKLYTGRLHRVIQSQAKNGAAVLDIQINKEHFKCFHRSMFVHFLEFGRMGGFMVSAYIHKDRRTIEGLKKIGPVMYQDDGKTEVPVGREPGIDG